MTGVAPALAAGVRRRARRSARALLLPACAALSGALLLPARQLLFVQPPAQHQAAGATAVQAPDAREGPAAAPTRRGAALLPGALAALLPGAPAAHALEDGVAGAPGTAAAANAANAAGGSSAKFQRVVVNVGDKDLMDREVFFWSEACRMKVLSDKVGGDKLRSVVMGYPGDDSSIGIEVKLDPAVNKRPRPKLLNYEVMQPNVNALNFVQIGLKGKIMELFQKVQESGGASTNGDPSYIDVESPRGVSVRLLPRPEPEPRVELISLNVEVPAFEPVVKFYQRAIGLQRLEYDPGDPPITKFSILMGSTLGGTNLLLSPVPDGRLKDRRLDEFEGVVMTAPNVKKVVDAATIAVEKAAEEAAAKEETLKKKLAAARATEGAAAPNLKRGTKAVPSVAMGESAARINDGVSNMILVSNTADISAVFA